jgi:WD40 repeat protein
MDKTYHPFGGLAVVAAGAAGVLAAVGMLMLTMLVVVADEPAGAAFPGQNGKIAFSSERDGNPEIYAMNPNGTALDRLTNNQAGDFSPAWSPDGNKIAFLSERDGNPEIYAMNPNGQGVDRLTNNPVEDTQPNWTPDGNRIAFRSARDGNLEIYAMNPNGTGVDRLTNNPKVDQEPDWQPLSPAPNPKPPNNNATKAPKVISTSPKANAKGVAPTASLRATFSEKMRASSVNATTFELFEKKKGSATKKLSARVSYEAATKRATLDPAHPLRGGVTSEAVVSTGAKDLSGERLDQKPATKGPQPKAWSFTVRR